MNFEQTTYNLVVTSTLILVIGSYDCNSHLCPQNTTYIASGDQCLFLLNTIGDFRHNKELCESKNATLWTVSSVQNLKDLCSYAHKTLPITGYAYFNAYQDVNNLTLYTWPHNNRMVQLPRQYWMDNVPEGLKCLELFKHKNYCRINDIPCWKYSSVVCEFLHPNPCRINNGGCEQTCIPRDLKSRTCKCETGMKFNETQCVKLGANFTTEKCRPHFHFQEVAFRAGNCFRLYSQKLTFKEYVAYCNNLNAIPFTINLAKLQEACSVITDKLGLIPGQEDIWLFTGMSLKPGTNRHTRVWKYDQRLVYASSVDWCKNNARILQLIGIRLENGSCCVKFYHSNDELNAICQHNIEHKINPCTINNGNCSKYCNVTDPGGYVVCTCDPGLEELNGKCIEKCKVDNGGCHHLCENVNDDITCSCRPGYVVNTTYNTECDIIDRCTLNNGGCQQICRKNWYGTIWCECQEGYILKNDQKSCIKSQTSFNNRSEFETGDGDSISTNHSVFNIFSILVAMFFISIAGLALNKTRQQT